MGIENINGKAWFFEDLYGDATYGFEVSKILLKETQTKFQKLMILNTPRFGKVLVLDGIVQVAEEDEAVYHEFMAHWPIFSHTNPKTVLIIGGGDGGAAREVLRHKNIKKVYLVEIDQQVVKMSEKFMPEISNGVFDDPRLKIIYADAAEEIKKMKNSVDVVILDTSDPIGPAKTLFSAQFIQNAYAALRDGGILIRQTGSAVMQPYEFKGSHQQMEVVFGQENVKTLLISPATYFGGYFSLVAAVKGKHNFSAMINEAKKRYAKSGLETKWYSGDLHKSLTQLPPNVKSMLDKERYGEEIVMDLQKTALPDATKIKKWSIQTCKAINMLAFGTPMMSDEKMKAGTSFVQYIETSAINYRQLGQVGAANIFTCAELPERAAMEYSMQFLKSEKGFFWHLPRGSFGEISEIMKETEIFEGEIIQSKLALDKRKYAPTKISAKKIIADKFKFPLGENIPAFELVMDVYDCDYTSISSGASVCEWAEEITKKLGLSSIGKADAPDFGHAKKKTAGPSVAHFFEGGSNISHYSANWLTISINKVSQKEFDLKKAISFTMKSFKAGKIIGWIIPRGANESIDKLAKKTYVFEVCKKDLA